MAELGLVDQLLNNPYFWVAIILVIVYFIVAKWKEDKKRPEQQAFYGAKVRQEVVAKKLGKHIDVWGEKNGYTLFRGLSKVGKIIHIDPIYKYPNEEEAKDFKIDKESLIETFAISFRKHGFVAWFMATFLKRYEKMLLDPKAFTIDRKARQLIIDPKVYMIDDSGTWTLATRKELKVVDDLMLKLELEDHAGRLADFTRVLSNLDPNQAIKTEAISHGYAEEEQAKKNRISSWVKGGK